MLFPCFAARLLGSFFGAESWFCRVWRPNAPKRHSRCISKPMRFANWSPKLQNPLFLWVLDATFDTEDHPNAGPKTVSLGSPGHAVSLFRGPASGKLFRCWVLVLPGVAPKRAQTPLKVHLEANARCLKPMRGANWSPKLQNPLFLWVLDATFDTEDHPNAGPKTVSLGSPGHAVSLFRGPASGKLFRCWVLVLPGVAPKRAQTPLKVHLEANARCLRGANWSPKLQNPLFLWVLDATFDTEDHPNAGPKTVSLGSPGHAVSLFRGPASGKLFRCWVLVLPGVTPKRAQTPLKVHLEANAKRSPWARQAMLFPRFTARLLGSFFGARPSFLEVLDATFDTEDHPNAGPKTVSLGSPGHAVSPFRGPASGKLFRCWVLVLPGVTPKRAQTPLKAHLEANARCKLKP